MAAFKQGYYEPKNPEKFKYSLQGLNETQSSIRLPKYRSSWELNFFKYCDLNPEIELWSSEPYAIKYYNPIKRKICKYYPDLLIVKSGKKYLIEIKPKSQILNPKSNYDLLCQIINRNKFLAAKKFCDSNDIIFLVVTESNILEF